MAFLRTVPLLLFLSCTALQAENQVLNGGFEDAEADGSPSFWSLPRQQWTHGARVRIDANVAHAGRASLLMEQAAPLELPTDAPQGDLAGYIKGNHLAGFTIATQQVPVEGGKYYDLRYWYRSAGLQNGGPGGTYAVFRVGIEFHDANDHRIDEGGVFRVTNETGETPDWVQVVNARFGSGQGASGNPFLAPPQAATAVIRLDLFTASPHRMPKVWIDDVEFEEQKP